MNWTFSITRTLSIYNGKISKIAIKWFVLYMNFVLIDYNWLHIVTWLRCLFTFSKLLSTLSIAVMDAKLYLFCNYLKGRKKELDRQTVLYVFTWCGELCVVQIRESDFYGIKFRIKVMVLKIISESISWVLVILEPVVEHYFPDIPWANWRNSFEQAEDYVTDQELRETSILRPTVDWEHLQCGLHRLYLTYVMLWQLWVDP